MYLMRIASNGTIQLFFMHDVQYDINCNDEWSGCSETMDLVYTGII